MNPPTVTTRRLFKKKKGLGAEHEDPGPAGRTAPHTKNMRRRRCTASATQKVAHRWDVPCRTNQRTDFRIGGSFARNRGGALASSPRIYGYYKTLRLIDCSTKKHAQPSATPAPQFDNAQTQHWKRQTSKSASPPPKKQASRLFRPKVSQHARNISNGAASLCKTLAGQVIS